MRLLSWLRQRMGAETRTGRNRTQRPRPRLRPRLELLEDRTAPASLVVTSAADPAGPLVAGTLRYEVNLANQDAIVGQSDTITFDTVAMGMSKVTLLQGELHLAVSGHAPVGTETIDGGGAVSVSGNHASRVFLLTRGVQAALTALTIQDGNPVVGGTGIPGGGIANILGTLTVTNSTFSGNSASFGGGIENNGGTLTVTNSTFSGNSAEFGGGGIFNANGTLTVTNSTFSGNSTGGDGGGIVNSSFLSKLTVTNCTLSGNSAGAFAGLGGGGIFNESNATLTVANTIIAGNTDPVSGPDVFGPVMSLGHNLIGNPSGASGFVTTDLLGVDPLLGPLQDNGGPTQTMALLPGSPAFDAGSNALVPAGVTTDQRGLGFARISGAAVDIGAFEQQQSPPVVTVNGPATDPEGTAVTFTGSFTGGATAIGPYNFTWHVTAGNGQSIADQTGTVSAPGNVPSFTFTPADDGAYTVSLTVTDHFNLTGTQSAALTATNVAPTATITGLSQPHPLFIRAADALNFSGAFSDPGTLDGHTVTWKFGDGSSTTSSFGPGGSASFSANHAFAAPGTYVVTLTVTDDDGGVGTAQMTVIVQTPASATGSLISYVQTLSGLNAGQQNALLSTLNAVIDSLNRGNTTAAKNQLGAFENKVKAFFQAGLLTGAQEAFLLSSADAIQQGIG